MSTPFSAQDLVIVASVRDRAGFHYNGSGPTDKNVVDGVRGFAREFSYWYDRVLAKALPKYQTLIIDRINPMIRSMELVDLPCEDAAASLVGDYARRNFVTAGGWALEKLAIESSPSLEKSSAAGIDAERREPGPPPVAHLYVIKSGMVTRNSDILKALKTHGGEAQKRLLQTDKKAIVRVVYAIMAGSRSTTFENGVYRPSSAAFWAEVLELEDETEATELAVAMAQEAGNLLRSTGAEERLKWLRRAVELYIAKPGAQEVVDWEFLAQRNMRSSPELKANGAARHLEVMRRLIAEGYAWPTGVLTKPDQADVLAEVAAKGSMENAADIQAMLPEV